MLSFLPGWFRGILALALIIINTFFWFPFLLMGTFIKLLVPLQAIRRMMTKFLIGIATTWIAFNSAVFELVHKIKWFISGTENLSMNDWYFVNCNHQSWSDIPIIQKVLNRKIPMLKFFLKQELIWVPIMGIAWWALDFPFMKRFSREYLKAHPEMKGKDLETTQKACEKFKTTPVTVFNFLEGTRFTEEKRQKQNSPYNNLLNPKSGGAAFVLGSMGEQMNTMLDVTIYYPDGRQGLWALCCGKVKSIVVNIRRINIPHHFKGRNYSEDREFKIEFQDWIREIWEEKDALLERYKIEYQDL